MNKKSIQVDENKFDKALHHPISTINKLEKLTEVVSKLLEDMMKIYGQIKVIEKDLTLYRQELLNSVDTKKGGE